MEAARGLGSPEAVWSMSPVGGGGFNLTSAGRLDGEQGSHSVSAPPAPVEATGPRTERRQGRRPRGRGAAAHGVWAWANSEAALSREGQERVLTTCLAPHAGRRPGPELSATQKGAQGPPHPGRRSGGREGERRTRTGGR